MHLHCQMLGSCHTISALECCRVWLLPRASRLTALLVALELRQRHQTRVYPCRITGAPPGSAVFESLSEEALEGRVVERLQVNFTAFTGLSHL